MDPEASPSPSPLGPGLSPPSTATPAPSTSSPQRKSIRANPRSCNGCNRKKIRCDKNDPCSACTRAGRPCVFPPQGPRIRRTKKTIIAEMSSRLADLEKTLAQTKEISRTPSVAGDTISNSPLPQTKSSSYSSPLTDGSREDVLVQRGSSSHYFNEVLLSRAIRQVSPYNPPKQYARQ